MSDPSQSRTISLPFFTYSKERQEDYEFQTKWRLKSSSFQFLTQHTWPNGRAEPCGSVITLPLFRVEAELGATIVHWKIQLSFM